MFEAKRSVLDETFVPQFNALLAELNAHLDEVAAGIIEAAVHRDLSEAPVAGEPAQLAIPGTVSG